MATNSEYTDERFARMGRGIDVYKAEVANRANLRTFLMIIATGAVFVTSLMILKEHHAPIILGSEDSDNLVLLGEVGFGFVCILINSFIKNWKIEKADDSKDVIEKLKCKKDNLNARDTSTLVEISKIYNLK